MIFLPLKLKNRSADYKVGLCAAEMYYALCDRVGLDEWNNLKRKYPEAQYFESLMGEIAFDDVYNLYMNREDCKRFAEATSSLAMEIVEWYEKEMRWVHFSPSPATAADWLRKVFELKDEMEQKYTESSMLKHAASGGRPGFLKRLWIWLKDLLEFPLRWLDARVQRSREIK